MPTMTGSVNEEGEIAFTLRVSGPNGHQQDIEFILDTGFQSELRLPTDLALALELAPAAFRTTYYANGPAGKEPQCPASLTWFGAERRVTVSVGDQRCDPLIGVGLLQGCTMSVTFTPGETVTLSSDSKPRGPFRWLRWRSAKR